MLIELGVERLTGDQTCPGNPEREFTLELEEPIGDRDLVDAVCENTPHTAHSYCDDDGIRWPAPG